MTLLLDKVLAAYGGSDKVRIGNVNKVEMILNKIVSGGFDSLQIITDFDLSLTRAHINGDPTEASYDLLINSRFVSTKTKDKLWELMFKYFPLDIDLSLSEEEKIAYMVDWGVKFDSVLSSAKRPIHRSFISEIVSNGNYAFRDNADIFLKILNNFGIPTLILAGGLGDIIEEILRQNSLDFPNLKVVSNFIEYDEAGYYKFLKVPMVHLYNKNAACVHCAGYFEEIKNQNRHNIILIGDNESDSYMSDGINIVPNAVLKIGFLNSDIDKQLPRFLELYDIVLVDDMTFSLPNLILSLVNGTI